jgi:hypothetical protein
MSSGKEKNASMIEAFAAVKYAQSWIGDGTGNFRTDDTRKRGGKRRRQPDDSETGAETQGDEDEEAELELLEDDEDQYAKEYFGESSLF